MTTATKMSGPRLIISEPDFRIVELDSGGDDKAYMLEVADGHDGLGVERWREFRLDNKHLRQMFAWMVRMATTVYAQQAEELERLREALDELTCARCICDGGQQGEGLVSLSHEPHCPLAR